MRSRQVPSLLCSWFAETTRWTTFEPCQEQKGVAFRSSGATYDPTPLVRAHYHLSLQKYLINIELKNIAAPHGTPDDPLPTVLSSPSVSTRIAALLAPAHAALNLYIQAFLAACTYTTDWALVGALLVYADPALDAPPVR